MVKNVHQQIVDDAVDIAAREGRAPEAADFMTASIANSGRMSPEEQRLLQRDLRAAELGTSSEGLSSLSDFDEEEYYEQEPDLYGETCSNCGFDLNYCKCSEEKNCEAAEEQCEKYFTLVTACENNPIWYEYESVPESEIEETKKRYIQNHKEQCGCGKEIKISVTED